MKNRKKWIIIGVAALVVIAAAAIGATRMNLTIGKQPKKDEDKIEVVRRGKFLVKVRESGYLRSFTEVDVRSNVEGEILEIFVKEGEVVEAGQPLLKIDEEQILEERKQAEANLDASEAQVKQAELRIKITEKEQASTLLQSANSVAKAKASLASFVANKQQRIADAETQVATTQNSLNQDEIDKRQSEISLAQAQLTLERTKASLKSAKIAFETAQSEYERNQGLFEKNLISKQALEESHRQLANATSQYETSQKEVESQKETIKSQEENINAREQVIESRKATLELRKKNVETLKESQEAEEKRLRADVEDARTRLQKIQETTEEEKELTQHAMVSAEANRLRSASQLKSQQERYEWTTVTAPMSGTITRLVVEEGEIITSGRSAFSRGEAIMRIADLTQMIVRTQINQVEIGKITLDQRAEITVDSHPGRIFQGRVREISPSATPRGQGSQDGVIRFEVDIEVLGSPPELMPGMSADVDIIVFEESEILQLPIAAVMNPEIVTVTANLTPAQLGQFQKGQKLKIRNLIGKEFPGSVGQISSDDNADGNLEILLDGSPKGLRTGPTELVIVISDNNELSGIEAQVESERQFFVMLDTGEDSAGDKKEGQKGVKTHIKVGERNITHFQITDGLKEGDRIFVPSMLELTKSSSSDDDDK